MIFLKSNQIYEKYNFQMMMFLNPASKQAPDKLVK